MSLIKLVGRMYDKLGWDILLDREKYRRSIDVCDIESSDIVWEGWLSRYKGKHPNETGSLMPLVIGHNGRYAMLDGHHRHHVFVDELRREGKLHCTKVDYAVLQDDIGILYNLSKMGLPQGRLMFGKWFAYTVRPRLRERAPAALKPLM